MDTTMHEDCTEEKHIGKHIIDEFFTRTRLTEKQPGHRLWVNNKERQLTPNLDNADQQADDNTSEQVRQGDA
eukprot:5706637-Amphidinium_carterae.1